MNVPEPEEGEEVSRSDYIIHALSFHWKIMMACIPPTSVWNGWATFVVSLVVIGLVTAFVGDLAGMFGCIVGLKKSVTAITFIALGTSLPDTFASKLAATLDPYADAAIGNVTGSNSVNVFLGLGFPWLLASIYHSIQGTVYEVPAGSLGFSVAVFTVSAIFCIVLLMVKRRFAGAELGGENPSRYGTGITLVAIWFIYILLSSLQAYGYF